MLYWLTITFDILVNSSNPRNYLLWPGFALANSKLFCRTISMV